MSAPRGLSRRAALGVPLWLAACGDDSPPPPSRHDFAPLRYGYLPPIDLNVARLDIDADLAKPGDDADVTREAPLDVVETLFALARDRLHPKGSGGTAKFTVRSVAFTRVKDRLEGRIAVRLNLSDGGNSGYAEAAVKGQKTGGIDDLPAAIYDLTKTLMDQMNVELEYQIRGKLKSWVWQPPPPPPEPVSPGELVPPPPVPPGERI